MSSRKKENGKIDTADYLRMLVGGYLVYLGADLIHDLLCAEATHIVLTAVAALAFTVVGGAVFLWELRAWRRSQQQQQDLPEENTESAGNDAPEDD